MLYEKTSEVTDVLEKHLGENINLSATVLPFYLVKNRFGIATTASLKAAIEVHRGPELDLDVTTSGSVNMGYGRTIYESKFDNRLRVGVGIKYVVAGVLKTKLDVADIVNDNLDQEIEDRTFDGNGFGFVANHSLVMASYISRATAAIIDMKDLLERG